MRKAINGHTKKNKQKGVILWQNTDKGGKASYYRILL
jgi:hypothetical protein